MSTKIYDAYKFHGDIQLLMRLLVNLRAKYVEHAKRNVAACLDPKEPFSEIIKKIKEAVRLGLNDPLNVSASAVVFFHRKAIYVKFFGIPNNMLPDNDRRFSDFHYQNSTDRPSGITAKEWAARSRAWDAMTRHGPSFGENGLLFDFVPPGFCYEVARYIKKEPPHA